MRLSPKSVRVIGKARITPDQIDKGLNFEREVSFADGIQLFNIETHININGFVINARCCQWVVVGCPIQCVDLIALRMTGRDRLDIIPASGIAIGQGNDHEYHQQDCYSTAPA